jgi:hypothetical protein
MSSRPFKLFMLSISLAALLGASARLDAQELTESPRLTPMWSTSWFGDYDRHLQRYLIKDPGAQLWVIIAPSFNPAHALELDCTWTKEEEPKPTDCILRSTDTEAPTWMWFAPPPPGVENLFPSRIKTTRHSVAIPSEAAQAFINAWVHMLRETRYPKDSEFVFKTDGTGFEFYAWWDRGRNSMPLMGLTISPEAGATRMLTDLCEHLIAYTKASEENRSALLVKCVEDARAIQAYQYK